MTTIKRISMPVDVEAGKSYAWCRCGNSQTLPLCDNSHAAECGPLTFVAEETVKIYLCSCTRTENPPYCDGFNCD
jgi:CDGSH-type Zn-finger protein